MTAPKTVPSAEAQDPNAVSYGFFMKAICVNLCFMTALTMFLVAVGLIFSFLPLPGHSPSATSTGSSPPVAVAPPQLSTRELVSVQHFEHIVQNGNQMANQMRYIVPEAQQMLNDAIRIFYEAVFKVNSIFIPDVPTGADQVFVPPLVDAPSEVSSTVDPLVREKRDLRGIEEVVETISVTSKNPEGTCPKIKRSHQEETFDPNELDPVNFQMEDLGDDEEELDLNKVRMKRLGEGKFRQLKEEYVRCKKLAVPSEKCQDVYKEVLVALSSIQTNMQSTQELLGRNRDDHSGKAHPSYKDHASAPFRSPPQMANQLPTVEKNPQMEVPLPHHSPVGFHEDMGDVPLGGRQWTDTTKFMNQFTSHKINQNAPSQKFVPVALNSQQQRPQSDDTKKASDSQSAGLATPGAASDFVAASGPFLSLCEKYARQGNPSSDMNPLNTNNNNQQQNNNNNQQQQGSLNNQNQPSFIGFTSWPPQFSNRGTVAGGGGNGGSASVPMTGESMQATAKVLFNPGIMGGLQNPVCFTAVPVQQRINGNCGFGTVNSNQQN